MSNLSEDELKVIDAVSNIDLNDDKRLDAGAKLFNMSKEDLIAFIMLARDIKENSK